MQQINITGSEGYPVSLRYLETPTLSDREIGIQLYVPDDVFENSVSGFNWWSNLLRDVSDAAKFNSLFVDTTSRIFEIREAIGALGTEVDPSEYQNNSDFIGYVKQLAAREYFNYVDTVERDLEVDDSYGLYARDLFHSDDFVTSFNGTIFKAYASSHSSQTLSDSQINDILASIAEKDAFSRRQLAAIDPDQVLSARAIAQTYYEAFDDAGLAPTAWMGTFLEEFVQSGSWAPTTFGQLETLNLTNQEYIGDVTEEMSQAIDQNEQKVLNVNGKRFEISSVETFLDFIGNLYNDNTSAFAQFSETSDNWSSILEVISVSSSIWNLANKKVIEFLGDQLGEINTSISALPDMLGDLFTNLGSNVSGDSKYLQAFLSNTLNELVNEAQNGTLSSADMKVVQLIYASRTADILIDDALSGSISAQSTKALLNFTSVLNAVDGSDASIGYSQSDLIGNLGYEWQRQVQKLTPTQQGQVNLFYDRFIESVDYVYGILDLAKKVFSASFSDPNQTYDFDDHNFTDTIHFETAVLGDQQLLGQIEEFFGEATITLINNLGHLAHRAANFSSKANPTEDDLYLYSVAANTSSIDSFVNIAGYYGGVFNSVFSLNQSDKTYNFSNSDSVVFFGTNDNEAITYTNQGGYHDKLFLLSGDNFVDAAARSVGLYIVSGDGFDELTGGSGDDVFYSGAGSDFLTGGSGIDKIYGGDGNDLFIATDDTNTQATHLGNGVYSTTDYYYGGDGIDAVDFSTISSDLSVDVDLEAGTARIYGAGTIDWNELIDIENVYDSSRSDYIDGSLEANTIHYHAGKDTYTGLAGDDNFYIETYATASGDVLTFGTDFDANGNIIASTEWVQIDGGADHDVVFIDGQRDEYTVSGDLNTTLTYTNIATGAYISLTNIEEVFFGEELYIEAGSSEQYEMGAGDNVIHAPSGITADDLMVTRIIDSDGFEKTVVTIGRTIDVLKKFPPTVIIDGDASQTVVLLDGNAQVWLSDPDFSKIAGWKNPEPPPEYDETQPLADPEDIPEAPPEVQENEDDAEEVDDKTTESINNGTPLIFDLDGDGIELVSLQNTSVYWDIDLDGFAEATGWVSADDGFLAIDTNNDGFVTDHSELFGTLTTDGFTELAVLDTNADGVINASDTQFSDLLVWQDFNQNGASEANELHSLSDFGIVSIDLNATLVTQTNEGNDITHVSTYTIDDGVNSPYTRDFVDVWFTYDNMNSIYNQDFVLDYDTLLLPNVRGHGLLPTLQIAMSLDNDLEDPNSLKSLVTDFSLLSFEDLFVDDGSVLEQARDIMFRWANVDDVDPLSRGNNVDARELEFIEEFLGKDYLQQGYIPNPGGGAGDQIYWAFNLALQPFAARLIAQVAGKELFEGDFTYNANAGLFEGVTGLSQAALDTLLAKAQDPSQVSDKVEFWGDVVRVIDVVVGVSNLSSADQTALETVIQTSDSTLDTQSVLDSIAWLSWDGDSLSGTTGDDTLTGGIGNDDLLGNYGNDTLSGGLGDDRIYGENGNDILNGQLGDDELRGDNGQDTYLYFAGQGDDTIIEDGTDDDKIVMSSGIVSSDLTFTRLSNADLKIELSDTVGGGSITVINQYSTASVELIEFSDTSALDISALNFTLTGTNGDDYLNGARYGGNGEDTIYGLDGNDTIYGNAPNESDYEQNFLYGGSGNDSVYGAKGDDVLEGNDGDDTLDGNFGNDSLEGGQGNDTLIGYQGNDTYLFNLNDGHDVIQEYGSGTDTILFGAGIDQSMISILRVNNDDLEISINFGTNGSITIENQTVATTNAVETLEFADGSTVDLTASSMTLLGTSASETLYGVRYGGSGEDTIYGFEGDDTIFGYRGSPDTDTNYLYAGTGEDTVYGASGIDFIDGGEGNDDLRGNNGADEIKGKAGSDTLRGGNQDDILEGGDGDDILYGDNHNDILTGGLGQDQLTGGNGYDTFTFKDGESFDAVDTITDYHASYDTIDIADILSVNYDPVSDVITDFVQITDDGTDSTLSVDVDGGGDNFVAIAMILNETGMTDEAALESSGKLITSV